MSVQSSRGPAPLRIIFIGSIGVLITFSILAKAAHDYWAATLVYLAALLLFCGTFVANRSTGLFINKKQALAALVLLAAFAASFHQSVNPGESYWRLMDWVAVLLIFFAAQQWLRGADDVELLVLFIGPLLLAETAINIHQKFLIHSWFGGARGTLINSTVNASWQVLVLPLFVVLSRTDANALWKRRLFAGAVFLTVLNIFLTASVTGLLCGVLLLIYLTWKGLFNVSGAGRKIIVAAFAGIFLFLAAIKIFESFQGRTILEGSGYSNRLYWWGSAWRMFCDNPWFGLGVGNFPSAFLAYKAGPVLNTLFAHTLFATLLAEAGLVGFLAFLAALGVWLTAAYKNRHRPERQGAFVGVLLFLVFVSINIGWEYLGVLLTFFVLLGIAVASETDFVWRPRRSVTVVLVFLGLGAIPTVVSPWMASQSTEAGKAALGLDHNAAQAKKCFEAAIELDPRSYAAYEGMANVFLQDYVSSKDASALASAIRFQREAIVRNRLSALLWAELALMQKTAGDAVSAMGSLREALRLHPANTAYKATLEEWEQESATTAGLRP